MTTSPWSAEWSAEERAAWEDRVTPVDPGASENWVESEDWTAPEDRAAPEDWAGSEDWAAPDEWTGAQGWTAPDDNGSPVASYDVRIAKGAPITAANFNASEKVGYAAAPSAGSELSNVTANRFPIRPSTTVPNRICV